MGGIVALMMIVLMMVGVILIVTAQESPEHPKALTIILGCVAILIGFFGFIAMVA